MNMDMVIAIVYPSSAEFWMNAAENVNFETFSLKKRKLVSLPESLGRHPKLEELKDVSKRLSLRLPLHILVENVSKKNTCIEAKGHLIPKKIPPESFIYLGKISGHEESESKKIKKSEISVYVACPELTFLQAASELKRPNSKLPGADIINLVVFGTELSGIYIHNASSRFEHENRPPITSAKEIRNYLEMASGSYGACHAKKAAKYLLDNSNSPMETRLSIFFTFPPSYGGFGLPRPRLNLSVTPEQISCDIVWEEKMTITEYDSNQTHLDIKQHTRDIDRQNLLIANGYKVVRVTASTMGDPQKREDILMTLQTYLNVNNKNRLKKYANRRGELWDLLMRTPVYDLFVRK